jgi:uncharacterized protein YndB with AHSA1/START domain
MWQRRGDNLRRSGEVEARREMITHSVEINRVPEDVFAYLDDLDRYVEWQENLISTRIETDGPIRDGSRGVDRRRVPGGPRDIPFEVTEHDPPRKLSFRGTAGPVRPVAVLTVEPVGDGSRSRMSLELDLHGHGFGKLVAPFARRGAAKEVQQDHARLKERLEAGG